jgi:hypothetical protein
MFYVLEKLATIVGLTLLISGCIYYPKRIEVYDSDCGIKSRKLVLDVVGSNAGPCAGGSVGACLAVLAAVGPVTAVVSGSIVVVGNTLYWLEKEGKCTPSKDHDAS